MTTDHLHTPHSHASPAPHVAAGGHATMGSGHSQASHQAAHAAAQHQAHAAAQAHAAHAAHAAAQAHHAGGAGAGALVAGQSPEDFMHPYMQSILGMLHNELAEKNLQLK